VGRQKKKNRNIDSLIICEGLVVKTETDNIFMEYFTQISPKQWSSKGKIGFLSLYVPALQLLAKRH